MLSETNYKIVQPLVYTSRLFTVCPVTFAKVGTYYQIKYSPFLVFYSYAIIVAFAIGMVLGVLADIGEGDESIRMKSRKNRYISICDMSVVFAIALYGVISFPYKIKRFITMLDIWNHIDSIIPITNYKKHRKNSIKFLASILLATTLLFAYDVYMYGCNSRDCNEAVIYIKMYISYYMLYYVLALQEIFFWHMVYFIQIRIVSLNEHLSSEKNNLTKGFRKLFVIPYNTNGLGNNNRDNSEEAKGTSFSGKRSSSKESTRFGKSSAARIVELLKIYGKIRETVEILNGSASFGIVLIMLSCLLHLIVTPYFFLVEVIKNDKSIVFIVLQGVWLIAHIGRLLIIVEPCQKCINEYKVTNNLISEMALLDFDHETKKVLKNFAAKFSYADINFHACGYFSLSRSLLTTIAGAVSTYLVILFQFNGNG